MALARLIFVFDFWRVKEEYQSFLIRSQQSKENVWQTNFYLRVLWLSFFDFCKSKMKYQKSWSGVKSQKRICVTFSFSWQDFPKIRGQKSTPRFSFARFAPEVLKDKRCVGIWSRKRVRNNSKQSRILEFGVKNKSEIQKFFDSGVKNHKKIFVWKINS